MSEGDHIFYIYLFKFLMTTLKISREAEAKKKIWKDNWWTEILDGFINRKNYDLRYSCLPLA